MGLALFGPTVNSLLADTTIPPYLNLSFTNSSTFADSDIYFLFSTGQSHVSGNTTFGNISGTVLGTGTYGPGALSATFNAGGQYWSQGYTYSGTNAAYTGRFVGYTLEQLKGGIQLDYADSTTVYVSLGAPMFLSGSNSISTFGTPSLTTDADPNWGVRWQPFEITRTSTFVSGSATNGIPGDQANLTAINAYAVPLQMKTFSGGTFAAGTLGGGTWSNPSYTGGTAQATLRTVGPGLTGTSLSQSLVGLTNSNTQNSSNWSFSNSYPNWYVSSGTGGTGDFLRIVGPSSGATGILASSTLGPGTTGMVPMANGFGGTFFTNETGTVVNNGAPSSNGPYPTFGNYVQYVGTANSGSSYQTPLSSVFAVAGTTGWAYSGVASVVPFNGATVSGTWINRNNPAGNGLVSGSNTGSMALSGTGYAIQISGSIYATAGYDSVTGTTAAPGTWVGSFVITLPPDQLATNNGTASNTGYNQTFSLYGSAFSPAGNYFEYTNLTSGTSLDFLNGTYLSYKDLPYDFAIWSQIAHDLSVGYNLGFIGSTGTIAGYGSGTTLNDMGIQGWTEAKLLLQSGTAPDGFTIPAYRGAWGGSATGFYNQYSELIYEDSETIYGNAYSDFAQLVQAGVNISGAEVPLATRGEAITYMNIEILPDVIPEAATWVMVVLAGASFWFFRRKESQS
ncbi:MAG: hypothetical protein Fur0032_04380 [Terrimicrobiaceae bacterium]